MAGVGGQPGGYRWQSFCPPAALGAWNPLPGQGTFGRPSFHEKVKIAHGRLRPSLSLVAGWFRAFPGLPCQQPVLLAPAVSIGKTGAASLPVCQSTAPHTQRGQGRGPPARLGGQSDRSGEAAWGCRASGLGGGAGPPPSRPGPEKRLPSAVWPLTCAGYTSGQSWPRWPGSRRVWDVCGHGRFCLLCDSVKVKKLAKSKRGGSLQPRTGTCAGGLFPGTGGHCGVHQSSGRSHGAGACRQESWAGVALHPEPWVRWSPACWSPGKARWSWGW